MSSGIIGEYYVICELLRNGYKVVNSSNPLNEDWDVAVVKDNRLIKIQVKAVSWPKPNSGTIPAINGRFGAEADFDILVIVVIGFDSSNKYLLFVIPKSDIQEKNGNQESLPRSEGEPIRYRNSTIAFLKFRNQQYRNYLNEQYENRWRYLETIEIS